MTAEISEDLKRRITSGEWAPGEPLSSEPALAAEYAVSRNTIRSALQDIAAKGLVVRKHGSGTYVTQIGPTLATTLTELTSMSQLIVAAGMDATVRYTHRELRDPTEEEVRLLHLGEGEQVWETRREVEADKTMVAVSFEVTRCRTFPPDFDMGRLQGSIFKLCEEAGHSIKYAAAEVHAALGGDLGLSGEGKDETFVGLYQTHFDIEHLPVFYARTYFREGRFKFSLMRTR